MIVNCIMNAWRQNAKRSAEGKVGWRGLEEGGGEGDCQVRTYIL